MIKGSTSNMTVGKKGKVRSNGNAFLKSLVHAYPSYIFTKFEKI